MDPISTNNQQSKRGCLPVLLLLIGAIVVVVLVERLFNPPLPQTKQEARKEQIDALFSAYDGSHPALEEKIKSAMNDPNSYEHIETRYRDDGSTVHIVTTFRGKNAFGGTITKSAEGTISSSDGRLLDWKML